MERIDLSTAGRNLIKHFFLLFSTGAALCLFLSPSIPSLVITGVVFIAVCIAASYHVAKPKKVKTRYATVCTALIAVFITFMGYGTFHLTWRSSGKVAALASALGIPAPILLTIVGLVGCAVGFYSFWVLGQWITNISYALFKKSCQNSQKMFLSRILNPIFCFSYLAAHF